MIFAIVCLSLLLVCGVYLYFALSKSYSTEVHPSAKTLYAERLRELTEDIQSGEIVAEQEQAAEQDIVRVTLDDEKQIKRRELKNAPPLPSVSAVLVILAAVSIATYISLGDLDRALGREPSVESEPPITEATVQSAIVELKQQLETNPDNAEGWALLGRTMMAIGNYPEALTALKKANELVPDAPGLMLQYADALAMNAGGEITEQAHELVTRVLEIDPNNIAALWLAGLGAAERHDNTAAIDFLTRAREISEKTGVSTSELDNVLTRLQNSPNKASDVENMTVKSTEGRSETLPPIYIDVAIAPHFEKNLTGEETLYVFARVEGQSGPPVAVRKAQNVQFPYRTSLDQTMSMAPQFRLAAGQSIVVAARLSHSGHAMPEAGDLVGNAQPFRYPDDNPQQTDPLSIIIDSTQH